MQEDSSPAPSQLLTSLPQGCMGSSRAGIVSVLRVSMTGWCSPSGHSTEEKGCGVSAPQYGHKLRSLKWGKS